MLHKSAKAALGKLFVCIGCGDAKPDIPVPSRKSKLPELGSERVNTCLERSFDAPLNVSLASGTGGGRSARPRNKIFSAEGTVPMG